MTADEIRKQSDIAVTAVENMEINNERAIAIVLMKWLPEIAAQLAELNQHATHFNREYFTTPEDLYKEQQV